MEPPPILMKAATIFMGNCGFVQVGILPELIGGDDNEIDYYLRMLIVMGTSWIIMNAEEASDFFSHLDGLGEFGDGLDNNSQKSVEKYGNEFYSTQNDGFTIGFLNHGKREINFPTMDAVKSVYAIKSILEGHLYTKSQFKHEIIDELNCTIQNMASECYKNSSPFHILSKAERTLDEFIVQLSTNLFSFFCKYYYNKYGQ